MDLVGANKKGHIAAPACLSKPQPSKRPLMPEGNQLTADTATTAETFAGTANTDSLPKPEELYLVTIGQSFRKQRSLSTISGW